MGPDLETPVHQLRTEPASLRGTSDLQVSHGWGESSQVSIRALEIRAWGMAESAGWRRAGSASPREAGARAAPFPCPHTRLSSSSKATPGAFCDAKQHEQGGGEKKERRKKNPHENVLSAHFHKRGIL